MSLVLITFSIKHFPQPIKSFSLEKSYPYLSPFYEKCVESLTCFYRKMCPVIYFIGIDPNWKEVLVYPNNLRYLLLESSPYFSEPFFMRKHPHLLSDLMSTLDNISLSFTWVLPIKSKHFFSATRRCHVPHTSHSPSSLMPM